MPPSSPCCRSCAARGCIVNIGSIGGLIAIPYQPLYSASKFALEGMTESLRLEVPSFGIRVVIIEPGDTKTEITRKRKMADATEDQQVYRSLPAALKRTADDEQHGPGAGWSRAITVADREHSASPVAVHGWTGDPEGGRFHEAPVAVCGYGIRDALVVRAEVRLMFDCLIHVGSLSTQTCAGII